MVANLKKLLALAIFVTLVVSFSIPIFAQGAKSYLINTFDATLTVNTDSTVDVIEKITYDFNGEYHKGWRSISHKDIGSITDIYVVDTATGQKLTYTGNRLNKTDPNSWGKYTYRNEDSYTNVEWYFDKSDGLKTWDIHYKVHGLIGFYKNYDEVYWNLFTEYEVPVNNISAKVILPEDANYIQEAFYRRVNNIEENLEYDFSKDDSNNSYTFLSKDAVPYEKVTLALDFGKGAVPQSAYWNDLMKLYWGLVSGLGIVILMLVYLTVTYILREYRPKYSKSIVAEYEPPKGLRPAEMDLFYREGFSRKTWPATIIDLATRGYLDIIELKKDKYSSILKIITITIVAIITIIFIYTFAINENFAGIAISLLFLTIFLIILSKTRQDYEVTSLKDFKNDPELKTYEKSFLTATFKGREVFSTKTMRSSPGSSRKLFLEMKKIEKAFLSEISVNYPGVYDKSITLKNKRKIFGFLVGTVIGIIFFMIFSFSGFLVQLMSIFLSVIISASLYIYFTRLNPSLSATGNDLWRGIEGFKTYIKTAEQYRVQNLTPELFEKFLPYAMIFGFEKKWAKNFELIVHNNPGWYHSAGLTTGTGISTGQSFSVSSFSTSFSSSFSSAFSSSGGGGSGGSGGGGSGGGGGGGGGGGAS